MRDSLKKALPDFGIVVESDQSSTSYKGDILIDALGLRAWKISITSNTTVSNDELKSFMFTWVYDSKSMSD